MKPDKDEIARRFGNASKAYAESSGHAHGADLAMLVELIEPQSHMTVLDVATGAGHTAAALAPFVKDVIACDLAPGMVAEAERLFASRGLTNVKAALADGEFLEYPADTFDVVTCRIAAHHFLDPQKALSEIARVLKPGGIFALEDSCAPADAVLDLFINNVEFLRDRTHVRAYTELDWRRMLEQAGFKILKNRFYRKTHDIEEWIDRQGAEPADKASVYAAFASAGEQPKDYFEIKFQDGRAITYTDDKVLILAAVRKR